MRLQDFLPSGPIGGGRNNVVLTNPELAYPYSQEYISTWLSGLLSMMVPFLIYLLMVSQIRSLLVASVHSFLISLDQMS
jgi:hypothetical protein